MILYTVSKGSDQTTRIRLRPSNLRLRERDTLGKFSAIFGKKDNFCDFLFAVLQAKPQLKRGLL